MLKIYIPGGELYSEDQNQFYDVDGVELILEHSLKSIHEWEQKYHKPYLSQEKKTLEERSFYIQCMTLNLDEVLNAFEYFYTNIPDIVFKEVDEYLNDPMTATKIGNRSDKEPSQFSEDKVLTAEVIYAYLVLLNIPFECASWNFNTLMTLIKVVSIKKSDGGQKMSMAEIARQNQMINEKRRKRFHSKG